MKIGRNDPCPCGSKKKYKRCCGDPIKEQGAASTVRQLPQEALSALKRHEANELIRRQQQGLGAPIVSLEVGGQRIVCAGNTIHSSQSWKTFPDFLCDYIKKTLGEDWGNAEIAKAPSERHPIIQWYQAFCKLQEKHLVKGEIRSAPITGVVNCYLGIAYSLYLLKHNAALQARLIHRLKLVDQFQGAYYELIVANSLIRAGFNLTLEDETDGNTTHCEFAATSRATGKKYAVEVKMRGVSGLLGRTDQDGTKDTNPISSMIKQLNSAFTKPAYDGRIIFLDLNAEPSGAGKPDWVEQAGKRLDRYEQPNKNGVRELPADESAYVLITNMSFHRELETTSPSRAIMAHGLGNDFAKPGFYRLSAMYRSKQKHMDVHNIIDALRKYPQIPSTFDGSLPSESFGHEQKRILVGETYFFQDIGEKGLVGTVTSATMNESQKEVWIGVQTEEGKGVILKEKVSDAIVDDYRAHPEAFFGTIQNVGKTANSPYELFEFFLETYQKSTKEKLLEFMAGWPDIDSLRTLSQEELAIEYSERCVAIHEQRAKTKQ